MNLIDVDSRKDDSASGPDYRQIIWNILTKGSTLTNTCIRHFIHCIRSLTHIFVQLSLFIHSTRHIILSVKRQNRSTKMRGKEIEFGQLVG